MKCYLCPRKCGIDRKFNIGYCGCTDKISIRRAAPHFWEEPCISGTNGSGTVFFDGCQLHCIYCQNYKISEISKASKNVDSTSVKMNTASQKETIINLFYKLKEEGVHNINLVTPDMYIHILIPIIKQIKKEGFDLPFIMNCSGYETVEMIDSLDGIIDIYLPDFKYMSPLLAKKYSNAPDYPAVAKKAIERMVYQHKKCVFDENGMLKKGVIVRHLVLPNNIFDSKKIIKYLYDSYGDSIFISIMNQYTPVKNHKYEELCRKLYKEEYDEVVDFALKLGIKNSYIQEGEAASESFIPNFSPYSLI